MLHKNSISICTVFLLHTFCSNATQATSQPPQEKAHAQHMYYTITQGPKFQDLHTELATTLHSFPMPLVSIVRDYTYEPGWFLPYINHEISTYQRKTRYIQKSLIIIGVDNNLPLIRKYYLSERNNNADLHFPKLWDESHIVDDIQKALSTEKQKYLKHDTMMDSSQPLVPKVTKLVGYIMCKLLTSDHCNRISLRKLDDPTVITGQNNSLIYITVSRQVLAKVCKNYNTYLEEELDKLGSSTKFADISCAKADHLDCIPEQFPHEIMDKLIADDSGTLVPVVHSEETPEEAAELITNSLMGSPESVAYDSINSIVVATAAPGYAHDACVGDYF